ncbi:MAG: hypothetical protein AAGA21_03860 [Pseudomonadota bacterium]
MMVYYLSLSASHIGHAVFDTQDLSTIRGSSALLLRCPEELLQWLETAADLGIAKVETIFTGASSGLFKIDASLTPDDLVAAIRCWLADHHRYQHFRFAVVTDDGGDGQLDHHERLTVKARFADYDAVSLSMPNKVEQKGTKPCSIDGIRPALVTLHEGGEKVSESVFDRHVYGRDERQAYYREIAPDLEGQPLKFADSLRDIVTSPPEASVPPILEKKLAVIWMDGNGFGALRTQLKNGLGVDDGLRFYSEQIKSRRQRLVSRLVRWALDHQPDEGFMRTSDGRIRFETLLWGGDEMLWVLPAWAAWDFMSEVQDEIADWTIATEPDGSAEPPLTHSAGMVFCNYKTPIYRMRDLAETLAQRANSVNETADLQDKRNAIQIHAVESVDIPANYLDRYRETVFCHQDEAAFTLKSGREWAALTRALRDLASSLPRSQLHKLTTASARSAGSGHEEDDQNALQAILERSRMMTSYRRFCDMLCLGDNSPAIPELLPIRQLLVLWPYLDPFGQHKVQQDA